MNLTELARYKDPNLLIDESRCESARQMADSVRWVGFNLAPSDTAQMRLKNFLALRPFASFPEELGWYVAWPEAESSTANVGARSFKISLTSGSGQVVAEKCIEIKPGEIKPLRFDWPPSVWAGQTFDLALHVPEKSGPLFLAVSRLLRRSDFIEEIKGNGVEIGPGMSPQIFCSKDTEVLYVDEMTREQWEETYRYKRDKWEEQASKVDFSRYRSGGALELPVPDASLDFIFGSHVFEHLVNPLRYLENWCQKLKPGGRAYMIIPYAEASLDYQQAASSMDNILAEYESESVSPTMAHYKRIFGRKAEKAFAERRSLHIHFYTPALLSDIFVHAGGLCGVRNYRIFHHKNYRELFFCAEKG